MNPTRIQLLNLIKDIGKILGEPIYYGQKDHHKFGNMVSQYASLLWNKTDKNDKIDSSRKRCILIVLENLNKEKYFV